MALIAINGIELEPQPAITSWEDVITNSNLDGTDGLGAYKLFRMQAPNLAGQTFNWDDFENQVLLSLQAYAPNDLYTGADVLYTSGVVSRKIAKYESPVNNSIVNVELLLQVIVEEGS